MHGGLINTKDVGDSYLIHRLCFFLSLVSRLITVSDYLEMEVA